MQPVGTAQTTTSGNRVDSNYAPVNEWYVNGPSGLEQGFTVPPLSQSEAGGSLTVELALGGDLTATLNRTGTGLTLTRPDGSAALGYTGLTAYNATGKALPASLQVQTDGGRQELLIHVNDAGAKGQITINPVVTVSTFVSNGLDEPVALAFDSAGNLYVANAGNNTISKVTPAGLVSTFVSSGLDEPVALAFDSAGNLYVANEGNSTISKVTPAGVVSTFVSSGLDDPVGLAFDSAGNLYVVNGEPYVTNDGDLASTISMVTPAGTVSTFCTLVDAIGIGGSILSPDFLAIDAAGNLYVAENNSPQPFGTISKVTPAGAVSTFVGVSGGFEYVGGLAVNGASNLYASTGNGTISEVTPAGAVSTFVSGNGISDPSGLAFDAAGNLYVANLDNTISVVATPGPAGVRGLGFRGVRRGRHSGGYFRNQPVGRQRRIFWHGAGHDHRRLGYADRRRSAPPFRGRRGCHGDNAQRHVESIASRPVHLRGHARQCHHDLQRWLP